MNKIQKIGNQLKGLPFAYNRLMIRTYTQRHGHPLWKEHPVSINLDTQNNCNLQCVYCNPHGSFIKHPKQLPLETIEYILKYFKKKKWLISYVYVYLNGEALLEPRLPIITKMVKDILGVKTVVYTNGTIYKNRHLLSDPNLNEVRFTISACTPETYQKIHGKPLFNEAVKTLKWLQKNKYWNQRIFVNFILFKDNEHELEGWKEYFKDFELDVRPLHDSASQTESKKLEGQNLELKGKYYDYSTNRDMATKKYSGFRPCDNFHALTVDVNGNMLQCATVDPNKFFYGNVLDRDIEEMWKEKIKQGVGGPSCEGCTMKRPDWKEVFEKYVW